MCGTLKYEGIAKQAGDPVRVHLVSTSMAGHARWTGHVRAEMKSWWEERGKCEPVLIHADSFIEGTVEVKTQSKTLLGVILRRDVISAGTIVGRKGEVKILTRPPANAFEKKIHHRWPVSLLGDEKGNAQEWTEKDVIGKSHRHGPVPRL